MFEDWDRGERGSTMLPQHYVAISLSQAWPTHTPLPPAGALAETHGLPGLFSRRPKGELARAIPQRLEPKTFLASERTFLSWISMAVTLGSVWDMQEHIRLHGSVMCNIDIYPDFRPFFQGQPGGVYKGPGEWPESCNMPAEP